MAKTVLMALVATTLMAVTACSKPVEVAAGPPCPSVDAAGFAAFPYKPRPNSRFEYHDTTFGYALGNGACSEVTGGGMGFTKYAVCDFTSPAVLEVEQKNGQHAYYTPALGQPLRVTMKDGAATCELVPKPSLR
jgi:CubicO group peptidase (beta-lactamase class C family)